MAQSSNAYEGFFRKLNISYVIAGEGALDLALAMAKPQEHFGTDESSPVAAGSVGYA